MTRQERSTLLRSVAKRLIAWFDRARRDLPWRRDRDAYRVWVSEVMLQQTTVAAVIPYFDRFLKAFPTVRDLAAADEADVLRLWEGLGYYRRARHLHLAARALVADHGGELPDDPIVWAALPGVGRYILGAVLSQAFDRRLPIVEANSLRVLCRLFGYAGDPRDGEGRRWLWATATELLPRRRVGDFNQSLMELGATVCAPKSPRCDECPVAKACVSRREGTQDRVPLRMTRPATTAVREVAVVIRRDGAVLLARRPGHAGRWSNMWEFPRGELAAGETHETAATRLARESCGLEIEPGAELLTVRHGVTRFAIELLALEAEWRSGTFASAFYDEARWLRMDELAGFPVATPQRRIARALADPARQRRLF